MMMGYRTGAGWNPHPLFLYNFATINVLTFDSVEPITLSDQSAKNPKNAMQILNQFLASLRRWSHHTAIAILLSVSLVQSQATIYTVSSGAYTAGYDTSQNGFTTWSGSGGNQLALQSLYYSVNGGPVSLLTGAIVNTGSSGFTSKYITATFSIPNGDIADTLTINGNTLNESIQFDNLGASGLNVSIFQYSDFVLGGPSAAGSQTVNLTPASGGGFATANQTGGGLALTWNGDVPSGTTLVQANSSGTPFGAFIGLGSNLDNTTLAAINTYAVFGYEFSASVLSGNLLTISENAAYPSPSGNPVPEPSSVALISSGMFILALIFRRRRN
ncbi:MAG: PEP-CTERM sorting domain-containing protein [Verrucomicrobiota bacterium]|jgi:hypothetical protein